ncbi:hypothetical protein D3C76_1125330 [compost metagenome]
MALTTGTSMVMAREPVTRKPVTRPSRRATISGMAPIISAILSRGRLAAREPPLSA